MRLQIRSLTAALALGLTAPAALAAPDCEALAEAAAARHGIPEGVMASIARAESGGGQRRSAWPWTLNMGGDGRYLETREEALSLLRATLEGGRRNVDVGCMQINWHWHHEAFDSLEHMIDPEGNTEYAARFLVSLWRREGTWDAAVAAYHSSEPDRGAAYLARVERLRDSGVGRAAPGLGGQAGMMPGVLSEGVLIVTGDGALETIAASSRGSDRRFGAQAPLVGFPTQVEPPMAAAAVGVSAEVPEGALPDLAAGMARLGTPRSAMTQAAPGGEGADRLARIRAEFRQVETR